LQLITKKFKSTRSKQCNRFRLLLEWFYSGRWFCMRICQGNLKVTHSYSNIIHTSRIQA
jgi:hypothetical protein